MLHVFWVLAGVTLTPLFVRGAETDCLWLPGTSKSQLLGFVHKIAPRGMYTSGKGSSAVGLTAYITKDPDTKEPVLESGALVRFRGIVTRRFTVDLGDTYRDLVVFMCLCACVHDCIHPVPGAVGSGCVLH